MMDEFIILKEQPFLSILSNSLDVAILGIFIPFWPAWEHLFLFAWLPTQRRFHLLPIDFASYKPIFIRHVMNMQLRPQGFLWPLRMDFQSNMTTLEHCSCSPRYRPTEIQATILVTPKNQFDILGDENGAACSYLLNNWEGLSAAAFTMAVAPTCATWCPEACKLDAADDLAFFWAFEVKCRSRSLHLLLRRSPAINLGWMLFWHLCAHTSCLPCHKGYLAWVTAKLLEKD